MNLDSAIFYSNDILKILPFYLDLGFTLEYQQGDNYVSFVFPNNVRLGIKKALKEREKPGFQTVLFEAHEIDELYKNMRNKEVQVYKELTSYDFGKSFAILDPDGNKLEFLKRTK